MRKLMLLLCLSLGLTVAAADGFVAFKAESGYFPLIKNGIPCEVVIDAQEIEGVRMAAENLLQDISRVCGNKPALVNTAGGKRSVIIGSYDTPLIQQLVKAGKIDGNSLKGKNEKYILQVVSSPMQGIDEALVIAGSDKRGTVYGIYELSGQIGVSPWYWWADVPVVQQKDVYIAQGIYTDGEPKVRYRGIFLNDEEPSLGGWVRENFGGFNSKFYQHVFELTLRLKGNFIWPAMWSSAFHADDPMNGELADKMGVVVGTSHHEPMGKPHQEWRKTRHNYGNAEWNYVTNQQGLDKFFYDGVERLKDWESVVTIGMRGDGDEAMGEDTNIGLLEKIVKNQRKIIEKATGKKAKETPQVWALYKEVQDYYDKGMRVPDDVTLLLCDDNWGNVRKLPNLNAKPRKGGYGMYYHFDYVGAPRNSKWVNISPIPRVWEQMNLTYEYGVRELWVVNVGDLKPMEYPITFFLDMAWDPDRFNAQNLQQHADDFCAQQFGKEYSKEIGRILSLYAKYNRRVTPELLDSRTYSFNYGEWERVVSEYNELALEAHNIRLLLPAEYHDAYDQLILYPVQACANLYNMYYAHAKNKALAAVNDLEANEWADKVEFCFKRDSLLAVYYNKVIAGGKWNHMMDQIHIGYRSWNNPDRSIMPAVTRVETKSTPSVFVEKDGYVSIEAEHYTRAVAEGTTSWELIPDFGKTLSGITTMPVTVNPEKMYLEYDIDVTTTGDAKIDIMVAPTLNFNDNKGMRYAISVNGGEEQVININGHYDGNLGKWQANPIIVSRTNHKFGKVGKQTIRFRPLEPGIVLEKIIIDLGGLKESYLGAPETLKK